MKKVLVTGASGGVGAACTQELISRGYTVITWSSDQCDFEHPERIFDHDLILPLTIFMPLKYSFYQIYKVLRCINLKIV